MKVRSHINLTVAFLLLTQLMLGVLRVQIVPLGWNVDEIIHFAHTRLVAAACLRDTVGLPWSLHREDSEIGENVTELMAFNKEELTKVYPRDSQSSPCELLFDKRRLTNSGYYIWAGLPMAIFNNLSDRTTINLGRLATLILGLIATTLTYSTARNLFPKNHLIHIGAASIMALNHQQGDITSGLNTDAGATFAISLLFWTLSGFSMNNIKFGSVFKILASLSICFLTKSTAYIGIPITALWLWANLPTKPRKWTLILTAISSVTFVALLLPVSFDIPAYWFKNEPATKDEPVQFVPAAVEWNGGQVGKNALLVDITQNPHGIVQHLTEEHVIELRGQTITVGGWVKLPIGGEIGFPNFATSNGGYTASTIGNGVWQFRSIVTEVPEEATYLAILLPAAENATTVLYDGLVLAQGQYPEDMPPGFSSETSSYTNWGNYGSFTNMISNSSIEAVWPRIGWKHIFGFSPNRALWSFYSWERTHSAWLHDLPGWLFAMYWSGFGGTQPGLSRWQLYPLLLITLVAATGLSKEIWRAKLAQIAGSESSRTKLNLIGLLTASTMLILIMVLLRTDIYPHRPIMLIFSGTRYGLPAMLPICILFTIGWMQLLPVRLHKISIAALVLILFLVSTFILLKVQLPYYNCTIDPPIRCLYP
ncbi:MAG: hypothetical protein ACJ0HE_05260 [Anaerolineales bacterium]